MARGLQFCPVDLHVHTPASKCFRGDVTPDAYVAQAIDAGLSAIAITDHNTGEWIDEIKQAAAGSPLTVFPGVEISVTPGVHIVAIFPEKWTGTSVNEFLVTLGLREGARGRQNTLVIKYGPDEVVKRIRAENGLPILAHIDDHKGMWKELRGTGETLIQLWQAAEFAAVEVVGAGLPEEVGRDPFTHVPAYYWSSDNPHPEDHTKHSHLGIGTRCSLFKLDDPITWEGLRQCFQDPEVRIRPHRVEAPVEIRGSKHPVLEHVGVQGGFLDGLDLTLNPNLNCVIGGRGTGKSTLLELIRYAFDIEPKTGANQRQADSILEHTFPPGAQITVGFRAAGTSYRVERSAEREPRVFRNGSGEPLDISPRQLLPVQVYGQKEIYEISQDPEFQLHLLDNYLAEEMQPLQEQESDLIRKLEGNAAEILSTKEKIADAEDKLTRLGAIREQLRRMEEEDFVSRLQDKSNFDQEQRLLQRAQAEVDSVVDALKSLLDESQADAGILDDDAIEDLPNQPLLELHRTLLERINSDLRATIDELVDSVGNIWAEGEDGRDSWRKAFDEQDEVYQALLREFKTGGERLSPDRYVRLQEQRRELQELEAETGDERDAVRELYAARRQLLDNLRAIRQQQYELRCEKAEELTAALNRAVRITIHPAGNREAYAQYLYGLCRGLNVRSTVQDHLASVEAETPEREAQRPVEIHGETRHLVPRIPRYLDPIDLAAAIRAEWNGDDEPESVLETRWDVSSSAMRRNLARLTEEQLFELEAYRVPDLPLIELQVGSGLLGYRPLSSLSVGQKCTALLGIVLLESPATLLVDQPEDDLDNQFIFDQIVETLRQEKERRQFVIATHNANIPVSGDAELIVVVQADEDHGWIEEDGVGSIDAEPIKHAVARILEGGERAFQIRREKYGIA